mmetsp:Transcript_25982/g.66867  ORF Transcript_25982/g.66867 Transcript_25982/m.66867 type:complete len:330 (-) Transcript_25982:1371-2360(-)
MAGHSLAGACALHRDSSCTAEPPGCGAEELAAACPKRTMTTRGFPTPLAALPRASQQANSYPWPMVCAKTNATIHVTACDWLAPIREKQLEPRNSLHHSRLRMLLPLARIRPGIAGGKRCVFGSQHRLPPTARTLNDAVDLVHRTAIVPLEVHWALRLHSRRMIQTRSSLLSVLHHLPQLFAVLFHQLKLHSQTAQRCPAAANLRLWGPSRWTLSQPDTLPTPSAAPFALLPPCVALQPPWRIATRHQSPAVPSARPGRVPGAQLALFHHWHASSPQHPAAPAAPLLQRFRCGRQPHSAPRPGTPIHGILRRPGRTGHELDSTSLVALR